MKLRNRKTSTALEPRRHKECPICKNVYPRLDQHLTRTHRWSSESEEYRKIVRKRSKPSIPNKGKIVYREDVTKLAEDLKSYLESPSGGGRTSFEAKQTSYKVRQVIQDMPEGFVETILDDKTYSDLEKWFVRYSVRNKASSAKAYVFAFKDFLSFAARKKLFDYDCTKDLDINKRFQKLLKFLSRRSNQQASDKYSIPITHEQVLEFESSEFYITTQKRLESVDKRGIRIRELDFREFITINLLLHNGCRPCVVANLTEAEFLNAEDVPQEECFIAFVANHKTISHGKAKLAIPYFIHKIFNIYRNFVRPENIISYEFAGRMVDPCLTTENGTRFTTSLLLKDVKSIWKKAGLPSKILSMYIRKLAVTGVHEYGSEQDKDRAAMAQCHSKNTATAFYRQKHQAIEAAKDSKIVRLGITGELKHKYQTKKDKPDDVTFNSDTSKQIQQEEEEPVMPSSSSNLDEYNPNDCSSSESDDEYQPKPKKKLKQNKSPMILKPVVQYSFEKKVASKDGRGQHYYSDKEREIIANAFDPFINGFTPSPNFVMKYPRMKTVRDIIAQCNLEERLNGKSDPTRVLGCVKGLINKVHGYKK